MRRSRPSSGLPVAMLVGIALPVGLLFAFFSLMPYEAMTGRWPLAITSNEVACLQHIFDRRPGQKVEGHAERYDLDSASTGVDAVDAHWQKRSFRAEGYADTVRVHRAVNTTGGLVIDFPSERLFRTQRSIALIPARIGAVQAKYAQLVADALGQPTPEVSFVRLFSCGRDLGLFMKEERITSEFLEKRGLADGTLVRQGFDTDRPDDALPEMRGEPDLQAAAAHAMTAMGSGNLERMDTTAAATSILLRCAHGNAYVPDEGLFAFLRSTGRLMPLFRSPRDDQRSDGTIVLPKSGSGSFFTSPVVRRRALVLADELRNDSARWIDRFAAVDALWAPALAQGRSIGLINAQLARQRGAFLARLFHPDLDLLFGNADGALSGAIALQRKDSLDPWLRPLMMGDTIRFTRNKYIIDHDVLVPHGLPVVLEKGVRITIAPGRSLVVNGPLFVRGTGLNPVFIRPQDEAAPYGTFCVNGDGTTRCELRGLRMSGGSQAWLDGRYHSGMLSVHDCHVVLEKCVISDAHGEDAVNLKRCHAEIRECDFSDAKDDLVDLDFVKGVVDRCSFASHAQPDTTMNANGDGLDVSGSHLLVRDCTFDALRDKGISIGEVSQVFVQVCVFRNDRLAIAAKDLSVAYVDGCELVGNRIAFGVYRKKPVFGGAHLTVFQNTLRDNGIEKDVDAFSTLTTGANPDMKVLQAFGIVGP